MRRAVPVVALCLALAAVGLGVPQARADQAIVRQVTVQTLPGRVQVQIQASGPVQYHATAMDGPARVLVDIAGATDGLGWRVQPVDRGPVLQMQASQVQDDPPVTRLEVDLARPIPYQVTAPSTGTVAITFPTVSSAVVLPGSVAAPVPSQVVASAPATGRGSSPVPDPTGAPPAVTIGPSTGVTGGAPTLNLDLRDAQLGDVLDALARLCGLNIVTGPDVQGKVTLHLVGVSCPQALGFLLDANQLGYRRVGQTIIIEPASKLTPPPAIPVVRVYKLQYLQPPLSQPEPLVGSIGATSAGGSGISGGAGPVKKDVSALLDLFKGTKADITYDDRTNSLVVTGTPEQQAAVQALLQKLDVPIAQVVVQAVVVDITATSLKDLGVEWSVLQGATGTPYTFQEVPPITPNPLAPSGLPPGQFGVGAVTRDLLLAKLHAFVSEGYAKVLSDPRIATPDGQEALIFAGDQIPIVNTTTAGNPPVTTSTVTFQPIGVTLKIIPKVNADRTITVQVHPVVTTVTSFTQPTPENPSGLPNISIREAVTSLRVADGDSIILGGLMQYSDIKNLKKVPFLGDLPFIGALFRLTTINHTESEVVILMTPRILGAPSSAYVAPSAPLGRSRPASDDGVHHLDAALSRGARIPSAVPSR
jgi:type IV pilus assembly protein PilQ